MDEKQQISIDGVIYTWGELTPEVQYCFRMMAEAAQKRQSFMDEAAIQEAAIEQFKSRLGRAAKALRKVELAS